MEGRKNTLKTPKAAQCAFEHGQDSFSSDTACVPMSKTLPSSSRLLFGTQYPCHMAGGQTQTGVRLTFWKKYGARVKKYTILMTIY